MSELCKDRSGVQQAIQTAKQAGKAPDTWYCLQLLDATGILTVPGVVTFRQQVLSKPALQA